MKQLKTGEAASLLAVASVGFGAASMQAVNMAVTGQWGWAAVLTAFAAAYAWMALVSHRECVIHEIGAKIGLPVMDRLPHDGRSLTVTVRRTKSSDGHVTYTIHTTQEP